MSTFAESHQKYNSLSWILVLALISLLTIGVPVRADHLYVTLDTTNLGGEEGSIAPDATITSGAIYIVNPDGSSSSFVSGLNNPTGLAFSRNGTLYVAAQPSPTSEPRSIFTVSPTGTLSTFSSGITASYLNGLAFDANGNLFMGRDGGGIDKVSPSGVATTFGSAIGQGIAIAPNGNIYSAATYADEVMVSNPAGARGTNFSLTDPLGLAFDQQGDLFVSEEAADEIFEITPAGVSHEIAALSGTGPFPTGSTVSLYGLAFDSAGNLYVAEGDGSTGAIGLVSNGAIQTFTTLPGIPAFIADPSVTLPVPEPVDLAIPALATLFLGMRNSSQRIRR